MLGFGDNNNRPAEGTSRSYDHLVGSKKYSLHERAKLHLAMKEIVMANPGILPGDIADRLNAQGFRTPNGRPCNAQFVSNQATAGFGGLGRLRKKVIASMVSGESRVSAPVVKASPAKTYRRHRVKVVDIPSPQAAPPKEDRAVIMEALRSMNTLVSLLSKG